jgi:hypothetical protein
MSCRSLPTSSRSLETRQPSLQPSIAPSQPLSRPWLVCSEIFPRFSNVKRKSKGGVAYRLRLQETHSTRLHNLVSVPDRSENLTTVKLTVCDLAKLLCKQKLTMSSFASPITHFLSLLAIDRVKHVLNRQTISRHISLRRPKACVWCSWNVPSRVLVE